MASRSADNCLIAPAGNAVAAGAASNLDRPCGSAKRGESCDCPCRRCRRRRRQRKFRLPRIRAKREEKVNCPRRRRWRPGHRRCHQQAAVLVQEGGWRGGQEVGFSHSWRGEGLGPRRVTSTGSVKRQNLKQRSMLDGEDNSFWTSACRLPDNSQISFLCVATTYTEKTQFR